MVRFSRKKIPGITLLEVTSDASCAAFAVLLALHR
jgi:hypothetical protein